MTAPTLPLAFDGDAARCRPDLAAALRAGPWADWLGESKFTACFPGPNITVRFRDDRRIAVTVDGKTAARFGPEADDETIHAEIMRIRSEAGYPE